MRQHRILALSLTLLLGACGIRPVQPTDPALLAQWETRQAALRQWQQWQVRGSVAVNRADEGWNARFFWHQDGARYRLRLTGPLGQGTLLLQGEPGQAVLRDGEGRRWQAASPEQLLRDVAGVELPVSLLREWILGLPARTAALDTYQLSPEAQLQHLQQQGWIINYSAYEAHAAHWLPHQLRLENQDFLIKLAISAWE